MATATAQDEDLLIIADDTTSDEGSNDIEFSFDFGEDIEEKKEEKAESTTDNSLGEMKLEETIESAPSEALPLQEKGEKTTDEIDLGMSFDSLEEKVEETATDTKTEEDFSFDIMSEEVAEKKPAEPVTVSKEEKVETTTVAETKTVTETMEKDENSMNDILSATIAKLAARKEEIQSDKKSKGDTIVDLKKQITDLEKQVGELEAESTMLESESQKIETNMAELEKMKLDPVKDHNAKRAKK